MLPTRLALTLLLATLPLGLRAGSAQAQTTSTAAQKLACVQASDKAQQQRVAGKLLAARDTLRSCVQDVCPGVVREACAQWLGEVQASLPSLVIGAKDADGKDVVDLKVTIDGVLVTEHLGGLAVPVDPGRHKMRYEKPDGTFLEEEILVGEGTKNRSVTVAFPGAVVAIPPSGTQLTSPAPHGGRTASTFNTVMGSGFAVVGAAVLGTSLYLDLKATSDVNALRASKCAPTCSASRVSDDQRDYDLAGAGLGVGIAAVGVAVYVYLAHPFGRSPAAATETTAPGAFRIVPSPHGSGFALTF